MALLAVAMESPSQLASQLSTGSGYSKCRECPPRSGGVNTTSARTSCSMCSPAAASGSTASTVPPHHVLSSGAGAQGSDLR
eukprot:5190906-Alexandrium_andersonii.AAC.1